jgi:hypothetical protein
MGQRPGGPLLRPPERGAEVGPLTNSTRRTEQVDDASTSGRSAAREAASPSPTPEPQAPARPLRGHAAKIERAARALWANGVPPPGLRPVHRDKLIMDWLDANGYGEDRPSPRAIARWFAGYAYKAPESPNSPEDRGAEAA